MTPPLSSCIINQFATTEHLDGETENFCITCLWCGKKLEVKVQSLVIMTLLVLTGFDFCFVIPTLIYIYNIQLALSLLFQSEQVSC